MGREGWHDVSVKLENSLQVYSFPDLIVCSVVRLSDLYLGSPDLPGC